jgi:hypothetical protein
MIGLLLHDNLMPHKPNPKMNRVQHPQLTTSQRPKANMQHCTQLTNPTTSFLTATTLIYAIGAGITAAAGTRLALQLILDKGFKLFSFQLPNLLRPGIVIYCHYLPVSGLGNLRACCLPWMWWPSLRPPLRNQTPISRYPLKPR